MKLPNSIYYGKSFVSKILLDYRKENKMDDGLSWAEKLNWEQQVDTIMCSFKKSNITYDQMDEFLSIYVQDLSFDRKAIHECERLIKKIFLGEEVKNFLIENKEEIEKRIEERKCND